jgi:hypothetical protein
VFCSRIAYWSLSPRDCAAAAAPAISSSLKPASFALSETMSAPSLVAASSFCSNAVSSVVIFWFRSRSFALSASERFAPACSKSCS